MGSIEVSDAGHLVIEDAGDRLVCTALAVTLPDGTVVVHESRGGSLSSARAVEVGALFAEIAYLGDGPAGGELVVSVTGADHVVCLGGLWTDDAPVDVHPSWPAAVDLALGLTTADTTILGGPALRVVTRDELETFHQRLLGALHG